MGGCHKWLPKDGWFRLDNPIKMDDLPKDGWFRLDNPMKMDELPNSWLVYFMEHPKQMINGGFLSPEGTSICLWLTPWISFPHHISRAPASHDPDQNLRCEVFERPPSTWIFGLQVAVDRFFATGRLWPRREIRKGAMMGTRLRAIGLVLLALCGAVKELPESKEEAGSRGGWSRCWSSIHYIVYTYVCIYI